MTWRVAVDIGGTFTDLVAWNQDDGSIAASKVLTVPDDPVQGVVRALEHAEVPLPGTVAFIHGSTIAINAVLQQTGVKTALLTTQGFRDVLEMGRKNRPDMYNLFFKARMCPVPRTLRIEVPERLDAHGNEIRELDDEVLAGAVSELPDDVESVAISFLHSYVDPAHEVAAAERVRALRPDVFVSTSGALSREIGEYERTCTVVVNAYVGPLVAGYLQRLKQHLEEQSCAAPLLITQSNGGVMTSAVAVVQPIRTLESGPAAGVTGVARLADALGTGDAIAFDMGGTSAKACVINRGEPEASTEYFIGGRLEGLPVQVPFLDIVEVGAGGGSIAYVDAGGGLCVGPRSAGSVPGPASYALGGVEPTITDANVALGRIDPDYFLGGEMRLDAQLAIKALSRLGREFDMDSSECALGVVRIANTIMASAIRSITLERGRDPRDFTLVAYGGAGAMHAASLAAELQIPEVIVPARAGTFAAFGMLVTDLRHDVARTRLGRLDSIDDAELNAQFAELEAEATRYVSDQFVGDEAPRMTYIRKLDLRYVGQFHPLTLTVPANAGSALSEHLPDLFHRAHAERYGHNAPKEPIEVRAVRVTAISEVSKPAPGSETKTPTTRAVAQGRRRVLMDDGDWHTCAVHRRPSLRSGAVVDGPAIIEDLATTVLIPARDRAQVLHGGHLRIRLGATA
ncbi:MAG: hydantoinase/oxoprolinase family protein [Candidatus Dormiibacterota bacterium]